MYNNYPSYPPPPAPRRPFGASPELATVALVLGIVAAVFSLILPLALIAIVCGVIAAILGRARDEQQMRHGASDTTARVGMWLGMAACGVAIMQIVTLAHSLH